MPTPAWRSIVLETLQMLSSEEEQSTYESSVPHVDVTTELVCAWFDDTYHPSDAHFQSCFTNHELAALQRFNELYEAVLDRLPPSRGSVKTWHHSATWQKVIKAAADARLLLTSEPAPTLPSNKGAA